MWARDMVGHLQLQRADWFIIVFYGLHAPKTRQRRLELLLRSLIPSTFHLVLSTECFEPRVRGDHEERDMGMCRVETLDPGVALSAA